MRTVTLSSLMAEVRQRADVENDPHITDAEVARFVNQSAAALHALVADVGEGDFITTTNFNTTAGQDTYTLLSGNFYKLVHLETNIQGYWRSLERWTWEKHSEYRNSNTWGLQGLPVSYRLGTGDTVVFSPVPDGVYQVTAYVIPPFNDMVSGSNTYDGRDGWEEWVVLDAAIKCATKDESDISVLANERDQVFKRICQQYITKDLDHPDKVRDTVSSYQGLWPWQVR